MIKINKRHFFICLLITFLFTFTGAISPELANYTDINNSQIVFAKGFSGGHFSSSRSSSGSFKSGSFSSPKSSSGTSSSSKSSSGGFKSGSFSNTQKSSSQGSSGSQSSNANGSQKSTSTKRSFLPIPIPIPIPWGHSTYYGGYGGYHPIANFIWSVIRLIILIAIVMYIVKFIRRHRNR